MRIPVSETVAAQLDDIRQSGETNVIDRTRVIALAYRHEFWELIGWIEEDMPR